MRQEGEGTQTVLSEPRIIELDGRTELNSYEGTGDRRSWVPGHRRHGDVGCKGYTLSLVDIHDLETEHEFVKCDVRDTDGLVPAMDGIDMATIKEKKRLLKLEDTSKAEKLLGWKPTFTFRDFSENLMTGKYAKDHVFPFPD